MGDWEQTQFQYQIIAQQELIKYQTLLNRTNQKEFPYLHELYSTEVVLWRELMGDDGTLSDWIKNDKARWHVHQAMFRARLGGDLPPGNEDAWDQYDSGSDYPIGLP